MTKTFKCYQRGHCRSLQVRSDVENLAEHQTLSNKTYSYFLKSDLVAGAKVECQIIRMEARNKLLQGEKSPG